MHKIKRYVAISHVPKSVIVCGRLTKKLPISELMSEWDSASSNARAGDIAQETATHDTYIFNTIFFFMFISSTLNYYF